MREIRVEPKGLSFRSGHMVKKVHHWGAESLCWALVGIPRKHKPSPPKASFCFSAILSRSKYA